MKIKELSDKSGLTKRAIRFYEEEGMLSPNRNYAGYRFFTEKDIKIINVIKKYQSMGMKLEGIKALIPCAVDDIICPLVKKKLAQHLENMKQKTLEFHEIVELIELEIAVLEQEIN